MCEYAALNAALHNIEKKKNFKLNGIILHVVASYKYLGHYITDFLSDDDDINRQRRTLFVQGNIILRKFNMCSLG